MIVRIKRWLHKIFVYLQKKVRAMEQRLRKKILLKGVTTNPDDYLCEDGELAGAMNVENTGGGLESTMRHGPEVVLNMGSDHERVVFEHKVDPHGNYIIWNDIGYMVTVNADDPDGERKMIVVRREGGPHGTTIERGLTSASMPKIEAIGNTLIIITETDNGEYETNYVLWKHSIDGSYSYQYLGTHIPELELKFGLVLTHRTVTDWEENYWSSAKDAIPIDLKDLKDFELSTKREISEDNSLIITNDVYGRLNKEEYELNKLGYFTQPFLVRYALKMYDGSCTMHSVPVFMPVSTLKNNIAAPYCSVAEFDKNVLKYFIDIVAGLIFYKANAESVEKLKAWSDIVKEVEIYVSAPVYTYNQTKKITKIFGAMDDDGIDVKGTLSSMMKNNHSAGNLYPYNVADQWNWLKDDKKDGLIIAEQDHPFTIHDHDTLCQTVGLGGLGGNIGDPYRSYFEELGKGEFDPVYTFTPTKFWRKWDNANVTHVYRKRIKNYGIDLNYKSEKEFNEEIRNCSIFYKLTSIKIDDLNTSDDMKYIRPKDGILNILTTSMQSEDEYMSHHTIYPKYLYSYNSRINFADVDIELYNGFKPSSMVPYMTIRESDAGGASYQMILEIEANSQLCVIKSAQEKLSYNQIWPYLYYPNTGVKRIVINNYSNSKSCTYLMEDHIGLNGSVNFNGLIIDSYDWVDSLLQTGDTNSRVSYSDKLFTSEAGNPWLFLPANINTIGNGKIIGMAAVTTALSQGQHGSFPMYCFTTEGIYSLSVNNTGGWVTSQVVTRDVMMEGTQLLQIDNAIVFVSQQGLMMLQGDKTELMSEDVRKGQSVTISKLPGLKGLIADVTGMTDVGRLLSTTADKEADLVMTGNLKEYLSDEARIDLYYDYTNQRVFVGREDRKYCWAYSLRKNMWSMQPWQLLNAVKNYPNCYAMYKAASGNYYMVKLNTNREDETGEDAAKLGLPEGMLVLTRPIKADENADTLKELENLTVDGRYDRSRIGLAVWGTRNYKDWHLVGSCNGGHLVRKHGSGFRAYVIGLVGRLGENDYIDTLTMQIVTRYDQKMHGMGY